MNTEDGREQWTLRLSLCGPRGEQYDMAYGMPQDTRRSFMRLKPPPKDPMMIALSGLTFDDVVELIKTREFRKHAFVKACSQMGERLAERMEDKEGWHDVSRAERLKDWGKAGVLA